MNDPDVSDYIELCKIAKSLDQNTAESRIGWNNQLISYLDMRKIVKNPKDLTKEQCADELKEKLDKARQSMALEKLFMTIECYKYGDGDQKCTVDFLPERIYNAAKGIDSNQGITNYKAFTGGLFVGAAAIIAVGMLNKKE
jgi:hypothetical protein